MAQINPFDIFDPSFFSYENNVSKKSFPKKKEPFEHQFQCTLANGNPYPWMVTLTPKCIQLSQNKVVQQSIELTYDLKLQVLHSEQVFLNFTQKNIKSQLIGFCLKNSQIGLDMSFTSKNTQIVQKWVDQLTKKINRIGFREYFKPIQKMGKGGYATIYEVQHILNGKKYAAKAHPKGYFNEDPRILKGFKNQIKILRKLNHTNCIKLFGVYESENTVYILLELLKGGNILQRMFNRDGSSGLNKQQIKKIIQGSLTGLHYLHSAGIIHRDIKLQNIMLKKMDCFDPVIVDYGFSTIGINKQKQNFNDQDLVFPHCGTPGYIAPQLFQNQPQKVNQNLSTKSDIFALGVTFYMLVTKKPLFNGKDPKTVYQNNKIMNYNFDESIEQSTKDLILKMIEPSPEERISAIEALSHQYFDEGDSKLHQIANMKTGQKYQNQLSYQK